MYLKRAKTPITWPIARKGTKYVIVPTHNIAGGVSLMLMLREHLGLGDTRREVRKAILSGNLFVNGKVVKNGKYGLSLNDTITLKLSKENYRLTYSESRKFTLEKITEKESEEKVSKIVGKKILKEGKTQISFLDGRTMITKDDMKIGDSALIELKTNKIKKVLPLEKGAEIIVVGGKHLGKRGKVEEMDGRIARISFKEGKKRSLEVNNLMVQK